MASRKQRETPCDGSKFKRAYKGKLYTLSVVNNKDLVAYKLNGVTYPTPSAAAKSVVKTEVNGWRFWRID